MSTTIIDLADWWIGYYGCVVGKRTRGIGARNVVRVEDRDADARDEANPDYVLLSLSEWRKLREIAHIAIRESGNRHVEIAEDANA